MLWVLAVLLWPAAHAENTSEQAPMLKQSQKRVAAKNNASALSAEKFRLVSLETAPFPYRGKDPETGKPFHDVIKGKRRGHTSQRGGLYWEKPTYSDKRSLLYLPQGFDITRPALIVVYFHGNQSVLLRDVRDRQQVPRQLADSGLNAALIAPQFAVDAADSSAGNFWRPGHFAKYMREATRKLAQLHGDRRASLVFSRAPVLLVAYSGGYHPASHAAGLGGLSRRILGMMLLDAPYGDEPMLAEWITRKQQSAFFVSVYGGAARDNNIVLRQELKKRDVPHRLTLPDRLRPGTVVLADYGDEMDHINFVTDAWTRDPLAALLNRIPGYSRATTAQKDENE
jgi:hypothetical protein